MNIALWTVQIVLAAVFAASGVIKGTWPKERLVASGQTGVQPYPLPVIRLTAFCELLAAAGLILPEATGIAPALTPAAAGGLCIVMIGAMLAHGALLRADLRAGRGHREAFNVTINVVIFALCLFVVFGRL